MGVGRTACVLSRLRIEGDRMTCMELYGDGIEESTFWMLFDD